MKWDTPTEKQIESYFKAQVKKYGGVPEKFVSPGRRSVPDQIVSAPGGRVWFAEIKRPGGKPTVKQEADHARRRAMGFTVYVCSTKEEVDAVVARELQV